jgi:hypothetical protein
MRTLRNQANSWQFVCWPEGKVVLSSAGWSNNKFGGEDRRVFSVCLDKTTLDGHLFHVLPQFHSSTLTNTAKKSR